MSRKDADAFSLPDWVFVVRDGYVTTWADVARDRWAHVYDPRGLSAGVEPGQRCDIEISDYGAMEGGVPVGGKLSSCVPRDKPRGRVAPPDRQSECDFRVARPMSTHAVPLVSKGAGKPRWSLLPAGFVGQMVAVMEHGLAKDGRQVDDWKRIPNARQVYYDALCRHVDEWWNGSTADIESGLHPLVHAACCCAIAWWHDRQAEPSHATRHPPSECDVCGVIDMNAKGGGA